MKKASRIFFGFSMDGTWIALSDDASSMTAKGIAVDGNDVYVVADYAGADCQMADAGKV